MLVHKVWRSHVTTAEITAGLISPLEAYGNEAADKLAARGALRNTLSMEYVAATRHTDSRVRLVRTKLIEINLLHVQNRTKTVRIKAEAPERRAKFDPVEAMCQLNRIGHEFSRVQVGKGRFTFKCRLCFLRGDRTFLKQLLGKPCYAAPCSALHPPVPAPNPAPDEPQSFFIGDTPSSEDDPFGCGGDCDQDHQDMPNQELQSSFTRPMNHEGMSLDLPPGHVMEEAKSGDATMEDAKPDEDPFGWGGDLDQDHQDMLDQKLPSSTDGPMDPAETYSNLLPDHEMKDSKTSGCATRTPDVLCDAVEQAGEAEGHAAAEPCAAEQARDLIFDDGAAAAYDSIADTVLELGAERPQMISDTMDVAVEMDAQTDFALVPVSTSPEPMAQTSHSRGKSRSPRRHVGEESFGLTSVHLFAPIRFP